MSTKFKIDVLGHGPIPAEYEDGVAFVPVGRHENNECHWMTSVELRELADKLEYAEKFYTEKEEQS